MGTPEERGTVLSIPGAKSQNMAGTDLRAHCTTLKWEQKNNLQVVSEGDPMSLPREPQKVPSRSRQKEGRHRKVWAKADFSCWSQAWKKSQQWPVGTADPSRGDHTQPRGASRPMAAPSPNVPPPLSHRPRWGLALGEERHPSDQGPVPTIWAKLCHLIV